MDDIEFKSLLLDDNWNPNSNERLLIQKFQAAGECEWNLAGFGPKDPGKNRDGAIPSEFDTRYPIDEDCHLGGVAGRYPAKELLDLLKGQVPFLIRFEIGTGDEATVVDTVGVPPTAKELLLKVAQTLGPEWQLMLFKSHMTLYRGIRTYSHGTQLHPPT